MNTHKNAPLTPEGRARMVALVVREGLSMSAVARLFRVNRKTVSKWVGRFREEGRAGLVDRSSRPHDCPGRTQQAQLERLARYRKEYRLSIPEAAQVVGMAVSTAGRWLKRLGLGRLKKPGADEPARRYERAAPGELLHTDIKKLARFDAIGHRITGNRSKVGRSRKGPGYDFVHVAIDDHSRLAYVEVHRDEKGATATAFLQRAIAWFERHGITVHRLMSDNGSCYRSTAFNVALERRGIRHLYTRPYTPKTNGKAERFIGTMVREWAYSRPYRDSKHRNQYLSCWLRFYNERRPHGSISRKPPVSRVPGYNLVGNYS